MRLSTSLNRLDVDEVAELMRKFSLVWNLREAQTKVERAEEPHLSPLDIKLTRLQNNLEHQIESKKRQIGERTSAFAPSLQEIDQLQEELSNLQTMRCHAIFTRERCCACRVSCRSISLRLTVCLPLPAEI